MKISKLLIVALAIFFSSNHVLGQTEGATGAVQSVRTYGDGRVLVTGFYFSTATACNCGHLQAGVRACGPGLYDGRQNDHLQLRK